MKNIRISERAPKTCLQCSRRHVKCDKQVPCSECVRRGISDACIREPVVVRGRLLNEPTMQQLASANDELTRKLDEAAKEILHLRKRIRRSQIPLISAQGRRRHPEKGHVSINDGGIEYISRGLSKRGPEAADFKLYLQDPSLWPVSKRRPNHWTLFYESTSYSFKKELVKRLISSITRELCLEKVHFSLSALGFLFNTLDEAQFQSELEFCLAHNASIFILDEEVTEHPDQFNMRRKRFGWFSVLYALLALAFYVHQDTTEHYRMHHPDTNLDRSHACYLASLECIHRSDFVENPNLHVLQAFSILLTTLQGFGNTAVAYSLLNDMIDTALRMGIPSDEQSVSRRVWTSLVIVDALEVYGRSSIITSDLCLDSIDPQFTSSSFQQTLARIALIRKRCSSVGHADAKQTLLAANSELIDLLTATKAFLDVQDLQRPPDDPYWVRRHVILDTLYAQIAHINQSLASYTSKDEWMLKYRSTCVCYSLLTLELFMSQVTLQHYRIWSLVHHVLTSSVFLIVDVLMNIQLQQNDQRVILVVECLKFIDNLGYDHLEDRGSGLINELLACITCTTPEGVVTFQNMSHDEILRYVRESGRDLGVSGNSVVSFRDGLQRASEDEIESWAESLFQWTEFIDWLNTY
ncbi:hypothetical protein KL936_000031 [Ogataea polymorpha]|nr:hypothetical protein KL936_000031 [Ogataea polymorpha]